MKNSIRKQHTAGFTLIELLVVIAVIGILAGVILASLNSARAKARDAKRVADLKGVATALEFYYDKYGIYPTYNQTVWGMDCGGWRGNTAANNTFLKPLVDEGFLSTHVNDSRGNCAIQYRDEKSGQAYRILFLYETKPNNDATCYWSANYSCIRQNYNSQIDG